jgi:hypothetical protein
MSDGLIMRQRPLPETRTAENSCSYLAETEIDGQHFEARSRRGAPHELARALVAAGVPDQPVSLTHQGLRGEMRYPSLHQMAGVTYVEGRSTILHRARYREDERFAEAEPIILPDSGAPDPAKNALQQPAGIMSRPEGQTRFCASCAAPFIPSRSWSLHCSPKCRVSAHRAKLSAGENALQPAVP